MLKLLVVLIALTTMYTGCTSHVMSENGRALVDSSPVFSQLRKNPEQLAGKIIMVGGVITDNKGGGDIANLEVAQLELLENGVPNDQLPSGGRFLVISGDLLEPALYQPGQFITVIGEVRGQKIKKLAGADYRYPLISARELRLFSPLEPASSGNNNPYQNRAGKDRDLHNTSPATDAPVNHPR